MTVRQFRSLLLCLTLLLCARSAWAAHSCYYGSPQGPSALNPTLIHYFDWAASESWYLYSVQLITELYRNGVLDMGPHYNQISPMSNPGSSGWISTWVANVAAYSNYRLDGEAITGWFYFGGFVEVVTECSDTAVLIPQ